MRIYTDFECIKCYRVHVWRCFSEMLSTCFDILVGIKNNVDDILYRQYSV